MLKYWRYITSVEKKQNEGIEDEHEEEGVQDSQASLYAVVDDVEDGVEEDEEMDDENLHDESLLVLREFAGTEVHEFEKGRVIIVVPVDFCFALGAVGGHLLHVIMLI